MKRLVFKIMVAVLFGFVIGYGSAMSDDAPPPVCPVSTERCVSEAELEGCEWSANKLLGQVLACERAWMYCQESLAECQTRP